MLIRVDPGKVRPRRGVIGIQLDGTLQTLPGYTVVLRAHVAVIGHMTNMNKKNLQPPSLSRRLDFNSDGDVLSGTYRIWRVENGSVIVTQTIAFP